MGWFTKSKSTAQVPKGFKLPFREFTEDEISAMSQMIRIHGQPDSKGFRQLALVALNTIRSDDAVVLVAKAMAQSSNPGVDVEKSWEGGSHYMSHLPLWMAFLEYAKPAVDRAFTLTTKQKESA